MAQDPSGGDRELDELLGRAAWERSSRLGINLSAKTPAEVGALGRQLREELGRAGISAQHLLLGPDGVVMQVDAALRGAAEPFSFGNSAEISAGMNALFGRGEGDDFKSRYEANLSAEEQRDEYDRVHRTAARAIGELGATALMYLGGRGVAWKAADDLPIVEKGAMGERLSEAKSARSGDMPIESQKRVPLSSGSTRVDHVTRGGQLVEAKFGPKARLRPRQQQAVDELGSKYRVDWWLPGHVGNDFGTALAGLGAVTSDQDRTRP